MLQAVPLANANTLRTAYLAPMVASHQLACAGGIETLSTPGTSALSPRALGSLHTQHARVRSTVDSLLAGDEEGYLSPLDDAFSVMSDDNPLLPAFYQVCAPGTDRRTCGVLGCCAAAHVAPSAT